MNNECDIKLSLTCYEKHEKNKSVCQKNKCVHWIDSSVQSCSIISSNEKLTFEEIGKKYNLTRMRICQIEKRALEKIKSSIRKKSSLFVQHDVS